MSKEMWLSSFAFCTFLLVACVAVFGYSLYHLTCSPLWIVLNTFNGFVPGRLPRNVVLVQALKSPPERSSGALKVC